MRSLLLGGSPRGCSFGAQSSFSLNFEGDGCKTKPKTPKKKKKKKPTHWT